MKLPNDKMERAALFRNTVRECEVSRPTRQAHNRRMRTIYLNGADSTQPAIYNRILEFVDTSSAYLYDPEGTRFDVEVGEQHGDTFNEETDAASTYFQNQWTRRFALTVALAVEMAHPFPSSIVKAFANRGRMTCRMLDDPADLSVWQEELVDLDDQEAMVHHYTMSLPSFERLVADLPPGERDYLVRFAKDTATRAGNANATVLPAAQSRLIIAAVTPNMIGSAQAAPVVSMAVPSTDAPVVDMAELWIWDDDIDDWNVVTMFRPSESVLWEMPNPQAGIDPFYKLTLFPTSGYIWGLSPIERLIGLQDWRSARMAGIDRLIKLNEEPPRAFLGVSGITDEKAERLNTPGGHFTSSQPGGSIQNLAPPIPPDLWTMIDGIDRMINRAGGLPPGADVGAENPGVRAGDQLEAMANLGSPRTRKRAMFVESFINNLATALLRGMRRGPISLMKPSGEKFLLSQIPGDVEAVVSAHSASPLYAERMFERALLMYDRQAIDDETLVTCSGLPMQSRLRAKARKIMEAKAERAKAMMDLQGRKIEADEVKAGAALRKALK